MRRFIYPFLWIVILFFCSSAYAGLKLPRELFNYSQYESRILALSNRAHIFSIGKTHNNRDIWCLELKSQTKITRKPKVYLLFGGTHSVEWASVEIPVRLAEHFSDFDNRNLFQSCSVYMVPVLNPDGFNYMQFIPDYYDSGRKNREFPKDEKRPHVYQQGVDLNRNYSYGWSLETTDPTSVYYQGKHPFSEPETTALKNLVETIKPHIAVSFHTPGKIIQYPFGYTNIAAQDDKLISICLKIKELIGHRYQILPDYHNYFKSGTEIDWLYGEKHIKAFRIEMGTSLFDTNIPEYTNIVKAMKWLLTNESYTEQKNRMVP